MPRQIRLQYPGAVYHVMGRQQKGSASEFRSGVARGGAGSVKGMARKARVQFAGAV